MDSEYPTEAAPSSSVVRTFDEPDVAAKDPPEYINRPGRL